jgi:quinoprotein dehydrogenase-associated probable ABC transporter substrate-binding protein
MRRLSEFLAIAALALVPGAALAATTDSADAGTVVYDAPLRVCGDPDAMPYSDKAGEGFENKLAEMAAKDLGTTVSYTWFLEREGFVHKALGSYDCDVVMGLPAIEGVALTRAYYRSSYVFISRADRRLGISSMQDPRLRDLRVGVMLVGADGAGTPPGVALGRQGIIENVVGFPVYGNEGPAPAAEAPIEAVVNGAIDIAAVWGPSAGYYASRARVPLTVTPITDTTAFLPQMFQYPIAMAVREGDDDLRDRLDAFISGHADEIRTLLKAYGVPLL